METKNNPYCRRDVSEKHLYEKSRTYRGFTLVELIVVITILVILGTIAFLNMGNLSLGARDGARISNLTNLKKWLDIYQIKAGAYPMPEGPLNILASGSIIGYQWFAKDRTAGLANISAGGTVDPSDSSIYTTYAVSYDQKKMQVMGFLEDGSSVTALNLPRPLGEGWGEGFGRWASSLIPTTFASTASDYSARFPTTLGDSLGILLGNTGADLNKPVQEKYEVNSFTGVDVAKTSTGYTAVFSKSDTVSGSGNTLVALKASYTTPSSSSASSSVPTRDSSLVAYWDMETTTPDGQWVADLSGHGNSGTGLVGLQAIGGEAGIRSRATRTVSGALAAMPTFLLMQTGSNFTVSFAYKINTYSSLNNLNQTYQSPNLPEWNTYTSGILTFGATAAAEFNTGAVQIRIFGGPNINFIRGLSGGSGTILTGPHIDIGEWHISTIVYDGNIFKVYDNGVFIGTMDATGFVTPSTFGFMFNRCADVKPPSFGSGRYAISGDNTIDEARVYNRALSESEIVSLYGATR